MKAQLGKDKIMQAALHLFAKRGFHSTSIDQIAAKAQVSKGLTYNYFKSKDALLLAIINQATQKMFDVASSMFPVEDYQQKLKGFLDQYCEMLTSNKDYLTFQLSLLFQPDLKEIVKDPIKARAEHLLKTTEEMFSEHNVDNAPYIARRFITELDGIAMHYLTFYTDFPLEEMLDHVFINYRTLNK